MTPAGQGVDSGLDATHAARTTCAVRWWLPPAARRREAASRAPSTDPAGARRTSRRVRGSWAFANAPLLVFLVIYVATCLLGAAMMVADYPHTFVVLFEYFSGTHVPHLTGSELAVEWSLLCGAPLALGLGYVLGTRIPVGRLSRPALARLDARRLQAGPWLPVGAFVLCACLAGFSIIRSGALAHVSAWLDYSRLIAARVEVFGRLRFFEFVNIYMFLPVSAAWVLIGHRRGGVRGVLVRWLPLLFTLVVEGLLYQKRPAIISLLIAGCAWLLYHGAVAERRRRIIRGAHLGIVAGLVVYFVGVVVPAYSTSSKASVCAEIRGVDCSLIGGVPVLAVYSAMSPLVRTSAPALYYPIVFPAHHPYYGLDVGQDVLGIGTFPDDNGLIWRYQNPHLAGTSAAPFQFTLYSETGLIGALVQSFLIGVILALGWRVVRSSAVPREWTSLLGAVELVFAVYLAISSPRAATTVSYGVLWGLGFVVGAALVVYAIAGRRASENPAAGRGASVA
jgi:hypothetical protein